MKIQSGKLIIEHGDVVEPIVIQLNYLASSQDEHVVDDFIAWWTAPSHLKFIPWMVWNKGTPPCSHTEVGFVINGELWSFSSTSRKELGTTGRTGTRWVEGKKLLRNPDRWLLQTKAIHRIEAGCMIRRANSLIGQQYDFIGVGADFILPIDIMRVKKTIYCSKAVCFVLTNKHRRVSPRHQWKWADNHGFADGYIGLPLMKGGK